MRTWRPQVRILPGAPDLNLRVAEFIRTNPPIDMPDAQVTRSLDILESPWPRREEIMLREWFESKEDGGAELSRILVEQILESGLEPVEPPPPPVPRPPPQHMVISPYSPPQRTSSCTALVMSTQPVAPSGCPSEIV